MRKQSLTAVLSFVLPLAACAGPPAPPRVEAFDPWCRPAPAGAAAAGCYVTLTANQDDRLKAVSTPAAERTEIHTMSMDGGIMRMRRLDEGLALPRDRAVALKPGAEHLMLIRPAAALAEGGTVTLVFEFADAPRVVVAAPVRRAPVAGAPH